MSDTVTEEVNTEELIPETEIFELSGKIRAAHVLSVIGIIFSVVEFFGLAISSGFFGIIGQAYLEDPTAFDISAQELSDFQSAIMTLGFGTGVDPVIALGSTFILIAVFLGFGAIFSLMNIFGCAGIMRMRKHPKHAYRNTILASICAATLIISFRWISGIMQVVAVCLVHSDYVDHVGKDRDFKSTNHLGFMRVIEIACVITLITNVTFLLFVTHSSFFDFSYWVTFIQLILMAVTLWLIWNRKQYGRQIIMGGVAVYLVLFWISEFVSGSVEIFDVIYYSILPILMLVYFATSRRAKAIMVEPFRTSNRQTELAENEKLWNPKSFAFWRNLLLYFCIFSVVGHWMEYGVCWLIRLGIVPGVYDPTSGIWRDMLNPFFVYGTAFVFIGLLLFPAKNFCQEKLPGRVAPLVASLLINTLLCAVLEYVMGLAVNDHLQLWDYSTMPFNFQGQICLLNTSFFGVLATLMTWLVYPNLEKAFAKIPHDVMNIVTVVILVFFVLVVAMYVINLNLPGNVVDSQTVAETMLTYGA